MDRALPGGGSGKRAEGSAPISAQSSVGPSAQAGLGYPPPPTRGPKVRADISPVQRRAIGPSWAGLSASLNPRAVGPCRLHLQWSIGPTSRYRQRGGFSLESWIDRRGASARVLLFRTREPSPYSGFQPEDGLGWYRNGCFDPFFWGDKDSPAGNRGS